MLTSHEKNLIPVCAPRECFDAHSLREAAARAQETISRIEAQGTVDLYNFGTKLHKIEVRDG